MKPKKTIVMLFLFTFLSYSVSGFDRDSDRSEKRNEKFEHQSEESNQQGDKKKDSFLNCVLEDQAAILTSPFRMKGTDWLLWGSVGLVTGVVIANDEEIYRDIKEFQARNGWVDKISPVVTHLGDGLVNLGIAGSFYLGGLLFKNRQAKDTARLLLMTFIHTGIISQLIKHLTGRQRPSVDDGQDCWHGPWGFFKRYTEDSSTYDAFPSGHTTVAWGTATVISELYKEKIFVPVFCYFLATLVALSRVTEDTHWLSDVLLGAVLGVAIGKFVVKKRSHKWNLIPVVRSDGVGIGVCYVF